MPPEITAGLIALAGTPPGVAASAGPSPPEPLGVSLFAAFLAQSSPQTQSSPQSVTPAAPKAPATQMLAADPKQTLPDAQALPKSKTQLKTQLKTMDTLPTLSFPPVPKATAKAGELPFPQAAKHQKADEDQLPPEKTSAPGLASSPANQAAALPAVFAALPLLPASAAPSAQAAPERNVPAQAAPAQPAPTRVMPAPASRADTPVLIPMGAASPAQAAPLQAAPQPGQPALAVPQAAGPEMPQPKAAPIIAVKPAAAATAQAAAANGLPRVPSPVSFAPLPAGPPAQAVPQEAIPNLPPSPTQAASQNTPIPSPLASLLASPLASAAAVAAVPIPARETPAAGPAKTTGKFLPAALKPVGKVADTSTSTTPVQEPENAAKADVPAAAPQPMPEKHAKAEPPLNAGGGANSAPASQAAAPADAAKAEMKLLSAGDRAEIVRQVAGRLGAMPLPAKTGAAEQISVQLHPKDWGSLQVSVTLASGQNDGAAKTITAHIVAETPQVKAALQSQTGALHQALRASGLHLEHLTVSVKAPEIKAPEAKTAAPSAPAGSASGQSQPDKSGPSYGQPNAGTSGGTNGFGAGGSQNNRQGQPAPALLPAAPDQETDEETIYPPLRPASGRIDTRA